MTDAKETLSRARQRLKRAIPADVGLYAQDTALISDLLSLCEALRGDAERCSRIIESACLAMDPTRSQANVRMDYIRLREAVNAYRAALKKEEG